MSKITPKCRLCRRERIKLFLKGSRCFSPKCPLERKGAVPPGVHGLKSGVRMSEYGLQLREKQKAKRLYGVFERQMKKYFEKASRMKGDRGENLLLLLERRLDNVVYRLGLAPSRRTARQLITHGHVLVNDRRVRVPSYQVKEGDEISLTKKGSSIKKVKEWLENQKEEVPSWLKRVGDRGKVVALPERSQMPAEIKENLIVEFYSR